MNDYQWYQDALAGRNPPIHEHNPQCGRFKTRYGAKGVGDGIWRPAAIWRDKNGDLKAAVGKDFCDPSELWVWVAKTPIAEADYKAAMANGHWPDDPPVRRVGDNRPPATIGEEIQEAAGAAEEWLAQIGKEITSQREADIAANRRALLIELGKTADERREQEKRPHLAAERAVDARYRPLIDRAKGAADLLRIALSKFMAAEEARKRKEAEAATAKGEVVAPVKVSAGGARGRKAGLRTVKRIVFSNYDLALKHFGRHEDVMALVEKLAQRAANANENVPGVEVKEEREAV